MKEYMMLGFRKIDGVSISNFEQKFSIHPLFYFRFEISKLEELDLRHLSKGCWIDIVDPSPEELYEIMKVTGKN